MVLINDPKISFIVPTRNAERTLAKCLESIKSQNYKNVELTVVDNGSTDSTLGIARRFADRVLAGGPERSAQRNQGARQSTGEILVFIDCDMVLGRFIANELVQVFAREDVHAAVLPERVEGRKFWDRCRQIEKDAYLGEADVEAARAFRATTFWDLGGYNEELTGPEDWELPDRLRSEGKTIGRVTSPLLHDESVLSLKDAFQKKRYYGRSFPKFMASNRVPLYRFGRKALLKPLWLLTRDPVHVIGLYVLKLVELAGIVAGSKDARRAGEQGKESPPLTVAFYMTGVGTGISGGDVHSLRLCEHVRRRGFGAVIVAPKDLRGRAPVGLGSLHGLFSGPAKFLSHPFAYAIATSLRSMQALLAPRASVVIATTHFHFDVLPALVKKFKDGSVLASFIYHLVSHSDRESNLRSSISILSERIGLAALRRFGDMIFVDNDETLGFLQDRGFKRDRLRLTQNAYDPLLPMPDTDNPKEHLIFCGRLVEEKGPLDVIEVARRLKAQDRSEVIYVLGQGPLFNLLNEIKRTENLDNLRLTGYVSEEQKWSLLGKAKLFLAPSKEEGWGIAVGEALHCGIPVVCFDLPAYQHFGRAVCRVPVRDSAAFVDRVVDLLESDIALEEATKCAGEAHLPTWQEILDKEIRALIECSNTSKTRLYSPGR